MSTAPAPTIPELSVVDEGPVRTVTLARPQARNALTGPMVGALTSLFRGLSEPSAVRVVVLRGEGGVFCAGGDVSDMLRLAGGSASADETARRLRAANRAFGALLEAIEAAAPVVVAAVEGVALGGGLGLACAADVTIAHETARFGMPEARLGIPPAQIAPFVARRVGLGAARYLALCAERIDARRAERLGIVHICTDDVDRTVAEVVARIRRCAPGALAATKRILAESTRLDLPAVLDRAADRFVRCAQGPEARAGMAAFLAKQPPPWADEMS